MNPISKRLTIEVTQEDIDHGTPSDCEDCPVTRGIRRILPDAVVRVEGDVIKIDGWTVDAPEKVSVFVDNFDRAFNDFDEIENDYDEWREEFAPFSFVLPAKGWKWVLQRNDGYGSR